MGERYWISGVQLALLGAMEVDWKQKTELFNEIYDKQFIGNEKDLERCLKVKEKGKGW